MNKKYTISLEKLEAVQKFVAEVSKLVVDVDLISGRYTVNAKSIMGIFSLDLSKPIEMVVHTDEADVLAEVERALKQFII